MTAARSDPLYPAHPGPYLNPEFNHATEESHDGRQNVDHRV